MFGKLPAARNLQFNTKSRDALRLKLQRAEDAICERYPTFVRLRWMMDIIVILNWWATREESIVSLRHPSIHPSSRWVKLESRRGCIHIADQREIRYSGLQMITRSSSRTTTWQINIAEMNNNSISLFFCNSLQTATEIISRIVTTTSDKLIVDQLLCCPNSWNIVNYRLITKPGPPSAE